MPLRAWSEGLFLDIRFAARTLAANRAVSIVAILSLALGIGANTAIFSLVNAILLRNLPVKDPAQLVILSDPTITGTMIGTSTGVRGLFSNTEFEELRSANRVFSGMFASESEASQANARIEGGPPEEIRYRLVTGEYFDVLGVKPLIGRTFSAAGERGAGSDPYAVLTYNFWRKRFALDASVVGKSLSIGKAQLTVIGVAPPAFFGETVGEPADVFIPMMMEPLVKPGRDWLRDDLTRAERVMWLHVFGRLRPGVTLAQANANANAVFQNYLKSLAGSNLTAERRRELLDQKIQAREGGKGASGLRQEASEPLLVLMVMVGLVLLIACVNVANLLLARASARRREISIRLALGAGRFAIMRQSLTESILLSLAGGVVGAVLAHWGTRLLLRVVSEGSEPLPVAANLDFRVFAFTAALSLLTGVTFGIVPAFRMSRFSINAALRENSRGLTGSGRRIAAGKVLVVAQVALSLLLLVSAGLFVRTLRNLKAVDLGYPREGLLLVRVDALAGGYKGPAAAALYQRLGDAFRSIPGVSSVTLSENGLFSGTESGDRITVEGYRPRKHGDDFSRFDQVGPGYFTNLGIPLLVGREIGPQDVEAAPRVCVVNEAFAKFYFGKENPIGRHVTDEFPDTRTTFEIIGVARDSRDHRLRGEVPRRLFISLYQGMGGIAPAANFELRTFAGPGSLMHAVRRRIAEVDSAIPIRSMSTLDDLLDRSLQVERIIAQLSAFFGAVALLLASIGLYGVLSYAVVRRTNEIGIRMALGASRASVLGMILSETALLLAVGAMIGIPAAVGGTRFIASRLFGVHPADPLTLASAAALLAIVGIAAGCLPARRASAVDPLVALRYE